MWAYYPVSPVFLAGTLKDVCDLGIKSPARDTVTRPVITAFQRGIKAMLGYEAKPCLKGKKIKSFSIPHSNQSLSRIPQRELLLQKH